MPPTCHSRSEAELSRCQSAYDREVAAAKQHLDALCDVNGKRLGKCHGVTLFERMIATPQGPASLIGARAGVGTAGNLAVTKRATLTRTVAGGLVPGPVGAVVGGAGFKKTKKIDARELYLRIEVPTLSCVVKCPPDAGARVRSFAAAVNTAASRAAIEEPQRPQRIREAEQRLAMAQAARGPIEAAQRRAQEITSNLQLLAGIDSARRDLESYRKSKSPQLAVPGSTALGKDTLSSRRRTSASRPHRSSNRGLAMATVDRDQSRRSRRRVSKVQQEPERPGDGEKRFVVRSTKTTDEPVL